MTLSHPWALPLAALAAPVVLAYLHRLHRTKRNVSSAILVRAIKDARPASHRARSKLRPRLSLALVLLALTADGASVDVIAVDIPAAGQAERTVRESVERGHLLVATIPAGDSRALDDRAEAPLASDGPVSVLLITNKPQSLTEEALRVHPRVALDIAKPGALPAAAHALIVVADAPGAPLPPAPHVVALGVPLGGAPLALGDQAAAKGHERWDYDAPYFRYVDLRDLIIMNASVVTG